MYILVIIGMKKKMAIVGDFNQILVYFFLAINLVYYIIYIYIAYYYVCDCETLNETRIIIIMVGINCFRFNKTRFTICIIIRIND